MRPTNPVNTGIYNSYPDYANYAYGYGNGYGCPTTLWCGYGCAGWGAGWGFGIGIGFGYSACNWSLWWGWNSCWNWGSSLCFNLGWSSWCGWGGWGAPAYACSYPAYYSDPVYYDDSPSPVVYEESAPVEAMPPGAAEEVGGAPPKAASAVDPVLSDAARDLHSRELELAQKYVKLGDLYFHSDRYAAAADAYARAIELAPEDAALYFIQSDAYFAANDYPAAANAIRRGLARDSELARLNADKTLIYEDPTVFAEQLGRLEGHVQLNPLDGDAFLVLGYNLAFSKRLKEARTAMESARRLQPSDPAIATFLTAILERELEAAAGKSEGR